MTQLSYELNKYVFVIPEFSEQHWRKAIDEAEGFEKDLRITQIKTLNLLNNINDTEVTPARLAWMNLWTKCISQLDGMSALLLGNSAFMVEVLERIALETFLHALTICQPLKQVAGKSSETIVDRLCAFTAWALSEDMKHTIEISHRSNLDMVWNPAPARDIKYHPQKREVFEKLFGEITIETDPVCLKVGRARQEAELRDQRRRLDTWLKTPELIVWLQKIQVITERVKPNAVSFFALMNEDDKSIRKRMKSLGIGFGYISYQKASMIIHGSTIEQLNLTQLNRIVPKISSTQEYLEMSAESVRTTCNNTAMLLALMQKHIWKTSME